MTRIIFDWLLLFVGGGILPLVNGESTVSAIAEQAVLTTTENILSVEETSSPSIDGNFISEVSWNNSAPGRPEQEIKPSSSFDDDELLNNSKKFSSEDKDENESATLTSNQTYFKVGLQKEEQTMKLEGAEETTSEMGSSRFEGDRDSVKSNAYLSSSEPNTAAVTKLKVPSTKLMSAEKMQKEIEDNDIAQSSDTKRPLQKVDNSELYSLEKISTGLQEYSTTKFNDHLVIINTESPEDSNLAGSSQSAVVSETKSSLSPKSATKKRSLNNTATTTVSDEVIPVLVHFTSPPPQADLIPGHDVGKSSIAIADREQSTISSKNTEEAVEEQGFIVTHSSGQGGLSQDIKTADLHSAGGELDSSPVSPSSLILPQLEKENGEVIDENTDDSTETQDGLDEHASKIGSSTSEWEYSFETSHIQDTGSTAHSLTRDPVNEDMNSNIMLSSSPLTSSNEAIPVNSVENGESPGYGITFDPDGLTHSGPQDPDSVVFSVPSKILNAPNTGHSTEGKVVVEFSDEPLQSSTPFISGGEKEYHPEEPVVNKTNHLEALQYKVNKTESKEAMAFSLAHAATDSADTRTIFITPAVDAVSSVDQSVSNPSENSSVLLHSPQTGLPILNKKHPGSDYGDYEMLQDSPHVQFPGPNQSNSSEFIQTYKDNEHNKTEDKVSHPTSMNDYINNAPQLSSSSHVETSSLVTETTEVETVSPIVAHQTEQSVIRPVKIKIASPSVSPSILPDSSSAEFITAPNPSVPATGYETTADASKVETDAADTSSPIILPNPAPSVTDKADGTVEFSTTYTQTELVPLSEKTQDSISTETSGSAAGANSTIAGVAVKTSVSVSLPLSKTKNETESSHPVSIEDLMKNVTVIHIPWNSEVLGANTSNDASTTAEPSTDNPTLTTTGVQATTAGGLRIRKPKIKIPGSSDVHSTRAQRPFTPSLKRPSSTSGPPVSIFKKARTRLGSITSSTTARPFRPFSTIRIHYASHIPGMIPGGELIISTEPVTTTEPTTTTEEYFSEEPFTDQTYVPSVSSEDDVTLIKVAGYVVLKRGIKWNDLLNNRHSPEYKETAKMMHLYLERLFRSSSIASRLWKIEIDGFSGSKNSRPVAVDFFLYLIKTEEEVSASQLVSVLHEKLSVNNTFGRFRVDPSRTAFELLHEERMVKTTPPPEDEVEPPIPQWAIAVIVIGAASLIFIILFAAVTMYGRHHMRRRYSSKLSEEDIDRSSNEWESKMAAAYENMAADTIYDAEDLHSDTYKKSYILD